MTRSTRQNSWFQRERGLEEHLYVEGEILFDPHAIQVLTDDDEIELAYFFDDHYLRDNPGRASYLLHEDWMLPATSGEVSSRPSIDTKEVLPPGNGEGVTYLAFLAFYDSGGLTDLDAWGGPCRVEGLRVPQLCGHLENVAAAEDWPMDFVLLRSQLRKDEAWGRSRAIWTMTPRSRSSGRPTTSPSFASTSGTPPAKTPIINGSSSTTFWAGELPDLAECILRYAKRWDVLTV